MIDRGWKDAEPEGRRHPPDCPSPKGEGQFHALAGGAAKVARGEAQQMDGGEMEPCGVVEGGELEWDAAAGGELEPCVCEDYLIAVWAGKDMVPGGARVERNGEGDGMRDGGTSEAMLLCAEQFAAGSCAAAEFALQAAEAEGAALFWVDLTAVTRPFDLDDVAAKMGLLCDEEGDPAPAFVYSECGAAAYVPGWSVPMLKRVTGRVSRLRREDGRDPPPAFGQACRDVIARACREMAAPRMTIIDSAQ